MVRISYHRHLKHKHNTRFGQNTEFSAVIPDLALRIRLFDFATSSWQNRRRGQRGQLDSCSCPFCPMNKPTVKKGEVDVKVFKAEKKAAPSPPKRLTDASFPDPDDLASKYGLESSEPNDVFKNGLSLEQQMEIAKKQSVMVQKLESRNREVEQLCILLETLEPLPGMDAEKYRRIIENPNTENVDFRDAKIVDLAKKCRKLQISVSKERSMNESYLTQINELQQHNSLLRMQNEAFASSPSKKHSMNASKVIKAADSQFLSSPTREQKTNDDNNRSSTIKDEKGYLKTQKELFLSNKKIDELKRKLDESVDENKKLSRALLKEVGDGISLEEAVDEGHKGRAQVIVMLKNKVRKLEAALLKVAQNQDDNSTIATGLNTKMTSATNMTRKSLDVDAMAEEELAHMSKVRNEAVEQLSEDLQRLEEEHNKMIEKHNGARARIKTLEADQGRHKTQMKLVIDKTDNDDKLITALKVEISRLKQNQVRRSHDRDSDAVEMRIQRASKEAANQATSHLDAELTRLRRLTTSQAEQLATQAAVITELRRKR